ncbi:MAG: glycosyltransferase family 4 protein [Chthoniobacterales bacterium]
MNSRFKILLIHNSADIYGASKSLLRLSRSLDTTRFELLVGLPHTGPLQELLLQTGVRVIILPELRVITRQVMKSFKMLPFLLDLPFSTRKLAKIIKKEGIDLVHTNTGVILNSAAAAKLAGAKHIWHIRDWFGEFGAAWKPYSKYIAGFSDYVLCVSKAIADQFPPSGRIQILPNGFPSEEFSVDRSKLRSKFRGKFQIGEALVIGVVGRIKFQRKGQEFLIQAAKILKDRGIAAKYLIVGTPSPGSEDHLSRLQSLIHELGLQSDVIFTGELDDTKPAYAAMDISVLPSAQPEPFAGVNMEAMAMSLPVVATRIGGSPDQVLDGETGFLCNPGDPRDMADKLEILCRDPDLRLKMGNAGMSRVFNEFSLEAMVRRIEAIYSKVLS